MNIPCKFRPLGNGGLPPGYTRLEFLQSTGTQYIDTEIVPTNETGLSLTAFPTGDTDTIPFGSRTSNDTESRFYAVRPRRLSQAPNTVIRNGYGWGYWQLIGASNLAGGAELIKKEETSLNWFNNRKASSEYGENELETLPFMPEFSMYLFAANISNTASLGYIGRIWNAAVSVGTSLKANFIPAIDPTGTPCVVDTVSKQALRNSGSGQFVAGIGTVAQLTILLRNLPATGGTLTLSLPAEANTPEMAEALQACHDTRGWTLTVHEYRAAAAATYSLRRVRSVVWCRREQSDLGSYVDTSGTRWQIDRCAAIFGALGQDPATYGYEPFDSVDAATAYWEITPYVETEEPC